jgi:hypothetical protein
MERRRQEGVVQEVWLRIVEASFMSRLQLQSLKMLKNAELATDVSTWTFPCNFGHPPGGCFLLHVGAVYHMVNTIGNLAIALPLLPGGRHCAYRRWGVSLGASPRHAAAFPRVYKRFVVSSKEQYAAFNNSSMPAPA